MKNRNLFILVVAILLFITFLASTSALILSGIREDSPEISVVIDDSGSGRGTSFISGLEDTVIDCQTVRSDISPQAGHFIVSLLLILIVFLLKDNRYYS